LVDFSVGRKGEGNLLGVLLQPVQKGTVLPLEVFVEAVQPLVLLTQYAPRRVRYSLRGAWCDRWPGAVPAHGQILFVAIRKISASAVRNTRQPMSFIMKAPS